MIHLVALGKYRARKSRMEMIAEKHAEATAKASRDLDRFRGQS